MATRKMVLLLSIVVALFLSASLHLCNGSEAEDLVGRNKSSGRRRMLEMLDEDEGEGPVLQKKKTTATATATKSPSVSNQTKLAKTVTALKSSSSSKNQTKTLKLSHSNSTAVTKTSIADQLKKLNSTIKVKKLNSTTSKTSNSAKQNLDLIKLAAKDKTTTGAATKKSLPDRQNESKIEKKQQPKKQTSWIDEEDSDDLVSEFRDLPNRFQQTLIPDLEKISTQSKAYITQANKQMVKGFKPYVGNKYAPTIASFFSFAFIVIPFLLVSLIFRRIKAFFSLQKLIIFIQIYLSIYFTILCLSSLATGLEPLKFFYATSASTYVCIQVMQTLGYVLYLLMLLMYLVLVFSTDSGLGTKFLGLAQTFVGYAVGLHYYVSVFHRVVLHQPPKTHWKVHGVYAACFLLLCLVAQAETRKKAYLEEGGEEGKKN